MRWFLGGGTAVLVAVAFFVGIAVRDNQTRHHGRQAEAVVVRLIQPASWDPFDSGRLVVRYALDGNERTRAIWIDNELRDYRVGQQVEVFVRGGHVRTDREPNDPAPWGTAAVLLGLLGVGAAWRGLALRTRKRPWSAVSTAEGLVLPLDAWRFAPRKAAAEIVGTELRLFLPAYFGSHRMVAALGEVGVHVFGPAAPAEAPESEVWFADGLGILNLRTKWSAAEPDLMLLFDPPVRVPPIRWLLLLGNPLPIGWGASRSQRGEWADGVLVCCADPTALAESLTAAGVQRVDRATEWFAERRATVDDPQDVAVLRRTEERERSAGRVSAWGWGGVSLLVLAGSLTDELWFLVPAAVVGIGTFTLSRVVAARSLRGGSAHPATGDDVSPEAVRPL